MRVKTNGAVCASYIDYEIADGCVKNVKFYGGCPGNLQAVARLVDGMPVAEAIKRLDGIQCRNGTSCPDQFAQALKRELQK